MGKMDKEELLGLGALGFLALPAAGTILLVFGIVLIAIMLGLFAVAYITLQNYHLMTATMFLGATLIMFYLSVKTRIITKEVVEKYPWMWLVIPLSFFLGYLVEMGQWVQLTIYPLGLIPDGAETTNFAILFVLFIGSISILGDLVETYTE